MPHHLPSQIAALALRAEGIVAAARTHARETGAWDATFETTVRATVRDAAEREFGRVPPHQLAAQLHSLCHGTVAGWSEAEIDDTAYQWPVDVTDPSTTPLLVRALSLLTHRLLVWNHGRILLRAQTLLEYQQIVGDISPDQLLMFAVVADRTTAGHRDPIARDLGPRELRAALRQPLLPPIDLPWIEALASRGLAEIHRHFNGTAQPSLFWLELLHTPHELTARLRHDRHLATGERQLIIETVAHLRDLRHLRALLVEYLLHQAAPAPASPPDEPHLADRIWRILAHFGDPTRYQELPGGHADRDPARRLPQADGDDPTSERALLYHAFRHLLDRESTQLRPDHTATRAAALASARRAEREAFEVALHVYLVEQNRITRRLIQPGHDREGLERFTRQYYRSPLRRPGERRAILQQAATTGRVRWLEARLSTTAPERAIRGLIDAAHHLLEPERHPLLTIIPTTGPTPRRFTRPHPAGLVPAIGAVLHFLRRAEPTQETRRPADALGLPPPHSALRADLWRQTFGVLRLDAFADLAPYLVGLDIAGSEIDTPVDVFAPMIRFLRSPFRRRRHAEVGLDPLPELPRLSLTCHAGEDFRHLLSGMRAVDEAMQFLEMRSGDRIGHGLALGIDPDRWADRMGSVVVLPLGEWLDDLVWFYDRLLRHPEHAHIAHQVGRELHGLARRLYSDQHHRWDVLHRAWCWRRCDPTIDPEPAASHWFPPDLHIFQQAEQRDARTTFGVDARDLWQRRMRDAEVRHRARQLIEVPIRRSWLPAIRQIQEDQLGALIRRNIAIEINPSSNLAIGPLDDLTEHPVFRWFPPGADRSKAHPFIVVGSDDPGVFATELLHEYAYLARAAELREAAPRQIADWLEDLRRTSAMFSFLDHAGDPATGSLGA